MLRHSHLSAQLTRSCMSSGRRCLTCDTTNPFLKAFRSSCTLSFHCFLWAGTCLLSPMMNSCNYLCICWSPVDFNVKNQWLLKYCTESGPPRRFHMHKVTWELMHLLVVSYWWEWTAGCAWGQLGAQQPDRVLVSPQVNKSAEHSWLVCLCVNTSVMRGNKSWC